LESFWLPLRPQSLNVANSTSLSNDFFEIFPKIPFERVHNTFSNFATVQNANGDFFLKKNDKFLSQNKSLS
jgi:hypothetical protein